ncbi:MAG: hypothetical protein J6M39_06460 [Lachnospiraceae bacterium]|nr:hypothetical protein [Lachnospiraceae bacterium]
MASINQLVSEIAHSLQQADSVPVRRAIRLAVIHSRNQLIRQSFEQHRYADKSLQQAFRITLIDIPDGDIPDTQRFNLPKMKRSSQRVPRPTRLNQDLPFLSVRTVGMKNPVEIPYVKTASQKFYKVLPGFCPSLEYDYINQYLYINLQNSPELIQLGAVIVEAPFENPFEISEEHVEGVNNYSDDDEFMIAEDMIGNIKKLVLETWNPEVIRETNEVPTQNLVK